jgi:hypothetical protein
MAVVTLAVTTGPKPDPGEPGVLQFSKDRDPGVDPS